MFVGLHHAGFATKDEAVAKAFWCGLLGFSECPNKRNWLGWDGKSYPIHLMPHQEGDGSGGFSRHVAIEVSKLELILEKLLGAGLKPFQSALSGERRDIISLDQPLDFGIGTIFLRDADGNVVEFVERGRGIFQILEGDSDRAVESGII